MPWDASHAAHRATRSVPTSTAPSGRRDRRGRLQVAPESPSDSRPGAGTARCASSRTGGGGGSPTVHPGVPGTDAALQALTRRRGRVPRPRLGARAVHHGRARRRHAGGPHDRVRPGRARSGSRPVGDAGDPLDQPCVSIAALCAHGDGLALIGSTPEAPANVWVWTPGPCRPAPAPRGRRARSDRDEIAVGEPFTLAGRSGRPVHGTLYRPAAAGTTGPTDRPPPLVTWCHGGPDVVVPGRGSTSPCSSSRPAASPWPAWTTPAARATDDAYRCALWGRWGVADCEDCLDAALHLAARGDIDAGRMAIRGGSAGGMTALNALAAGEGFGACVSWYGVTDLMGLVATTHDFEAHYTDRLIGPLPESRALYVERSPVSRAGSMAGSVLLLQGTEDAVVPPAQASVDARRPAQRRAPAVTCDSSRAKGTDSVGRTRSPHASRPSWRSTWRNCTSTVPP